MIPLVTETRSVAHTKDLIAEKRGDTVGNPLTGVRLAVGLSAIFWAALLAWIF